MPDRSPRPAPVALAIALAVIVVAGSVALVVRLTRDDDGRPSATPTAPTTPTTAGSVTSGTTTPDTSPSNLSADQARTVAELKTQVAEIRGLEWKRDLPIRIISVDELDRRIRDLTNIERAKHPDEEKAIEAVLKLLQLVPADLDYTATIDDLLEGGVLGFYDDEAKELFVAGDPDDDLDVATQSTMVHELNHALTDQHFDFGTRNRTLSDQHLGEEAYALSAMVEGDAELVRTIWTDENLTPRQQLEAELGSSADPSAFDNIPGYIIDSLYFPYGAGLDFATTLHDNGGFAAVDDAYRQPPTSTEEILHPDRYIPGRTWTRPALPDLAAATGCTAVDTSTIGEFDMSQTLDLYLPVDDAVRAADGWNGDAYRLVRCGEATGMVERWQADTPGDLTELADSLGEWSRRWSGTNRLPEADGRFSGPGGSGRIIRTVDRVDLVIASDASTSDRLSSAALAG
ncbi:MAG: hypothetical protein QOH36_504 [Actinomycetota bacterium]|nr:hypothetical protein [Actinomycetota bacterium]